MSAWFVSKRHIDILVTYAQERVKHDPLVETPDKLGAALWEENARSLDARYGERPDVPEYTWEKVVASPGQVAKALSSYDYQTCEHDAWQAGTPIYDLTRAMAFGLLLDVKGADEAEWSP